MKDLSNENIIHVKKNGLEYIQFNFIISTLNNYRVVYFQFFHIDLLASHLKKALQKHRRTKQYSVNSKKRKAVFFYIFRQKSDSYQRHRKGDRRSNSQSHPRRNRNGNFRTLNIVKEAVAFHQTCAQNRRNTKKKGEFCRRVS